ncbi:MAG: hemerythrin-like domain-containing protein [Gammaproteobacteria bacterium]|jgi:hemerythrin-like domain-containing protein
MHRVIERLHAGHSSMFSMLDILERELVKVEQAENPNFKLMDDVLRYLTRYSDVVQHPMEDLVYARLADRSPTARTKLAPLPAEHRRFEQLGHALHDSITHVADGAMALRAQLADDGKVYVVGLRKHLDTQEAYLFPLATQYLDDTDLADVEKILAAQKNPIFSGVVDADFRNLYEHIYRSA